jgi:hypothetical protein
MAGHLRTVITATLSVVNYKSNFTVVDIKVLTADLGSTFMELETGLLRAINNEGSHWRTNKDLAKEDALEYKSLALSPDIPDLAAHSFPEELLEPQCGALAAPPNAPLEYSPTPLDIPEGVQVIELTPEDTSNT